MRPAVRCRLPEPISCDRLRISSTARSASLLPSPIETAAQMEPSIRHRNRRCSRRIGMPRWTPRLRSRSIRPPPPAPAISSSLWNACGSDDAGWNQTAGGTATGKGSSWAGLPEPYARQALIQATRFPRQRKGDRIPSQFSGGLRGDPSPCENERTANHGTHEE